MPPFTETLPRSSDFWEACARHTARQTCRTVQHIYLCDPCARRLTEKAFNDRPPIYHGETVAGYCGLCNQRAEVTLRLWFACGICWNVIIAYQKTFVASGALLAFWRQAVQPKFPNLLCEESEVVRLTAFARGAKTKKQLASELALLDFLVSEIAPVPKPIFHIELKTGPGSIDDMTEFQLDVNDSNDIIGAVKNTGLPAYIFHSQVVHEYEPPTRYSVARAMWFTDIWTLKANQKATRQRQGESKKAGYYRTEAFKPIDRFVEEIAARAYEQLARRIGELALD
ncbi:MAG: hypothetical protein FJW34_11295 [Acidobacteria bacterium]|nr:hypothetical protein [Acidobacteriota bacterium]